MELNRNIIQNKLIEFGLFGKVARQKAHRAEFGKVYYVRFHKYGRGDIEFFANVRKVREKVRVNVFFIAFVNYLLNYFFAYYHFAPNSEHSAIILNFAAVGKRFDSLLKKD